MNSTADEGMPMEHNANHTGHDMRRAPTARREHSTERVRLHRCRRKAGLRPILVEVFEFELDVLVGCGLLQVNRRDDTRIAVAAALEKLIGAAIRAIRRGELEVK